MSVVNFTTENENSGNLIGRPIPSVQSIDSPHEVNSTSRSSSGSFRQHIWSLNEDTMTEYASLYDEQEKSKTKFYSATTSVIPQSSKQIYYQIDEQTSLKEKSEQETRSQALQNASKKRFLALKIQIALVFVCICIGIPIAVVGITSVVFVARCSKEFKIQDSYLFSYLPQENISSVEINSLFGDVFIQTKPNISVIEVWITRSAPDLNYLNLIGYNVDLSNKILSISVSFDSSFVFGCPDAKIEIFFPQNESYLLDRLYISTGIGNIYIERIGALHFDLDSKDGQINLQQIQQTVLNSFTLETIKGDISLSELDFSNNIWNMDLLLKSLSGSFQISNLQLPTTNQLKMQTDYGDIFFQNTTCNANGVIGFMGDAYIVEKSNEFLGTINLKATKEVKILNEEKLSKYGKEIEYTVASEQEKVARVKLIEDALLRNNPKATTSNLVFSVTSGSIQFKFE